MGSQFVDFNGDGHLDYLTATFDGSPHVAYGSAKGFDKPVRLKDAQGQRILISYFWNYEDSEHQVTGRALGTDKPARERCISALAYDWDGDGDYDLLLGSYENGSLYRQMNEGDNANPRFTGRNIPVMAGEQPFALPAKMTAPRLVDWDGDGDRDLVVGSFGDSYGQTGTGGGVYLSRNLGREGKPRFGELETLIPPSPKGHSEPTRPDAGLYPEVVDIDGDGDLDLVVGGYSMWTPKGRQLTAAEQARVAELRDEQRKLRSARAQLMSRISAEVVAATEGMDRKGPAARQKSSAVYAKYRKQTSSFAQQDQALTQELSALVPSPQRKSFVWLYERQG